MWDTLNNKFHPKTISFSLGHVSEVDTVPPTINQILQFNGTKYVPSTLSLVTNYSSLSDVSLTGIANNQISVYNSGTSKWNN